MEKTILKVQVREEVGKGIAKRLRGKGLMPAVVYKDGKSAVHLQMSVKEFEQTLHTKAGENVLITLQIEGGSKQLKDKTVIIKEIQHEPIKDAILHVDFNEISLTETIKVDVPVVLKGEPAGVKQDGGVLDFVIRQLHVECLPTNIPEGIDIDVSLLKIGDSVMVKNAVFPEGVKVLNEPELIVAIVKPPHVEKPPEEVVEEVTEPELIRKEKAKEEEEEAEALKAKEEPAKQKETK